MSDLDDTIDDIPYEGDPEFSAPQANEDGTQDDTEVTPDA